MKQRKYVLTLLLLFGVLKGYSTNYYVNDAATAGDVYCTAAGTAGGNALTAATGNTSIQYVIDNYALGASDTVFIDAGTYTETMLMNGLFDRGTMAGQLVFTGVDSTLTIINHDGSATASWQLTNASYTTLTNFRITQANNRIGIHLFGNCDFNHIQYLSIYNTVLPGYAIDLENNGTSIPDNNKIHHNTVWAGSFGIRIKSDNNSRIFYDNEVYNNYVTARGTANLLENNRAHRTLIYRNCFITSTASTVFNFDKANDGMQMYNNYIVNTASGGRGINWITCDPATEVKIIHNSFYTDGVCFNNGNNLGEMDNVSFINNIGHSISEEVFNFNQTTDLFLACDHNLIYHPSSDLASLGGTTYANLAAWQAFDHVTPSGSGVDGDENSVSGDPQYTATGTGDLSIPNTSPAMNVGENGHYAEDILGETRPMETVVEMGAFEFQVPLPVELAKFEGHCNNENVELTWLTLTERNNDFFELDFSHDGQSFKTIDQIIGAGTTNTLQLYNYDSDIGSGYYRLTQVDFDGSRKTYSSVHVNCESNEIDIWSNQNIIYIDAQESQIHLVQLIALNGKLVRTFPVSSTTNQVIAISVPTLSHGVYIVKVLTDNNYDSRKIVLD